ncbi:hypothetical protein, partial [Marivita sp.]|uniref:hypothetical protein n=1 Tax=Marivita sp. TaxID=2003365 RepID=UPI003F6A7FA0
MTIRSHPAGGLDIGPGSGQAHLQLRFSRLLKNSFGACVDGNFRAIEDHFVGWYRQLFFLKIKQDHQK